MTDVNICYIFQDSGLVIVSSEEGVLSLSKCSDLSDISVSPSGATLISQVSAEVLNKAGEGTLGKSNQVTVPASKQNVVGHVDSVLDDKGVAGASVTNQTNVTVHVNDKNKPLVDISDNKEQTVTQISKDNTNKVEVETANVKDVNSNNVKRDLNLVSENDAVGSNEKLDSKLDQSNNNADLAKVDSGIKIELDLLADSQGAGRTDGTETYGLSKSMVARLAKITDKPDYKQGLCTSISFESDVTYHRESEDELLDNEETESLDKADKQNRTADIVEMTNFTILHGEEGNSMEKSKEIEVESPTAKVRFKIGEGKMEESASGGIGYGSVCDQFMDELHFRAYGKASYMVPVESVDDASSMLVEYDPNENISNGDITDDRFEEFESNADSEDEESEMRERVKDDLDSAISPSVKVVSDEFVDALPGSYGYRKTDNIYPVESVDDIGSMVVCYDPNETVSVGDITDSRLEEFESNANSSEDESERKGNTGEDLLANISEKPKVLSLADRPGLVGVPGIFDPSRFLNATQSCDDVSSMMVEYDQSETVSVSDVTDMFENVDNTEMTEDNVRRKDYVPGNFSTIGNWIRSVSRDESEVVDQNAEDRSESGSGDHEHERIAGENDVVATQLEMFASNYVKGIIQDASRIICGDSTENRAESGSVQNADLRDGNSFKATDVIDQDTSIISGEPLNISTPSKKDVSSEGIMPLHMPSDRSSVDILSPITHVTEQETNDGVEFFSYKLQTQASVILSSTGKSDSVDVTLEEKDQAMSPMLSDISGYGVCLSGEGLEEMEKYYKEMAAISELVRQTGLTDGGDMNWDTEATDRLASLAAAGSPVNNEVFFDAEETTEENVESEGKTSNEESKNEGELQIGDTAVVEDPDNKTNEDSSSPGIIDDWARKDYEIAAGHGSEEVEEELEKLTDETKDTCSSTDTLDTESDKQTTASAEGLSETVEKKERNASGSPDSEAASKRKKSKKQGKEKEGKRSSAEARSSASDVDKHLSGSLPSAEAESEKHGKRGSHSKKKKDAKDENCSLS